MHRSKKVNVQNYHKQPRHVYSNDIITIYAYYIGYKIYICALFLSIIILLQALSF